MGKRAISMKNKHARWNALTTEELSALRQEVYDKNASFPQRKAKRMMNHLDKILGLRRRTERLISTPAKDEFGEFGQIDGFKMILSTPNPQNAPRRSARVTYNEVSTRK